MKLKIGRCKCGHPRACRPRRIVVLGGGKAVVHRRRGLLQQAEEVWTETTKSFEEHCHNVGPILERASVVARHRCNVASAGGGIERAVTDLPKCPNIFSRTAGRVFPKATAPPSSPTFASSEQRGSITFRSPSISPPPDASV